MSNPATSVGLENLADPEERAEFLKNSGDWNAWWQTNARYYSIPGG